MSVRFSISIAGKTEFDRAFNRVNAEISDFTDIWKKIADWLKKRNRRQFLTEGGAGSSGKWQALSPAYEKAKAIDYPNQTILRRTDRLFDSLTKETSDSINRITKDTLEHGTSVPYAKYHQDGTPKMPQRKIFDLTASDKTDLTKTIQRELVKIVRAQGFETFEF